MRELLIFLKQSRTESLNMLGVIRSAQSQIFVSRTTWKCLGASRPKPGYPRSVNVTSVPEGGETDQ